MKAYKNKDGVVRLFRPDKNMQRMTRSAARLAFPVSASQRLIQSLRHCKLMMPQ